MKKLLKKMELEWKILLMAALFFTAFIWTVQEFLIDRLENLLVLSVDPNLENSLRKNISGDKLADSSDVIASIKRHKQWRAMIPVIVSEQRRAVLVFSFFIFLILLIFAFWILTKLTKPLKNLATVVGKIGEGETVSVESVSGGALGKLEQAVDNMQEELLALREKSRRQGMESAWQDIAKVMAHEIKNPLTPIRLTLDRIEEKVVFEENLKKEELSKFLGRINNQVDTLERLVNQFRSFSKEPDANPSLLNCRKLLENISIDMMGKIQTDISGEGTVYADPNLLNQVLLNLWKNSLEASASRIDVNISQVKNQTTILVKDNGEGMKSEDLESVWLPYFTNKKGGTGLGLAVVKKIIESMNGFIIMFSEGEENGVTVTVTLPAKGPDIGEKQNG